MRFVWSKRLQIILKMTGIKQRTCYRAERKRKGFGGFNRKKKLPGKTALEEEKLHRSIPDTSAEEADTSN